ncbi:putative Transcriptional repressor TCF25 [Trypanosoma vivax]|nr:hypothetical protein TRVL_09174 [Trypanosoma vivax]KAH8604222.1 putative Transcriptional repressor TCF25 [Trypanosoma vivax]
MSTRQLRRLHDIVRASTAADADDGDEASECIYSTRKGARGHNRQRKQRQTLVRDPREQQEVEVPENPSIGNLQSLISGKEVSGVPPSASVQQKSRRREAKGDKDLGPGITDKESYNLVSADQVSLNLEQQQCAVDEQRKKRQRGKKSKAKRREQELEEELLLEAALREREQDVDVGAMGCDANLSECESTDLLGLLSLCNPQMLDSRLERIRRFGPTAVEDVGDGRVPARRSDNRPNSQLFAEHPQYLPRFRRSVLATPNRYCWPPYDGLGATLAVQGRDSLGGGGSGNLHCEAEACGPLVYYLDVSAPGVHRADWGLAQSEASHELRGVIDCLGSAPYHIPTLIAVSGVFETMGNLPRAQEAIDLALYHVGVLLSLFPLRQTARHRVIPFCIPSNRQLFQILRCGIQQALRKAAARTAWETAKLVYSLDSTDPLGMLLLLDYLALRARGWAWLVHVYYIVTREVQRKEDPDASRAANLTVGDKLSNRSLSLSLSTLPGYFFSAALAKYFLERELEKHDVTATKPSKLIRSMSPAELQALRDTPSASFMLAHAIGRFPSAAVLLVEKVGSHATPTMTAAWDEISRAHGENSDEKSLHIARLWVARNAEMWTAAEPSAFLRRVCAGGDGLELKLCEVDSSLPQPEAWNYDSIKTDDILGSRLMVIPEHLLRPDTVTEEDMRAEAQRGMHRELTPLERDMLLRFRALYGPLTPPASTMEEEFTSYVAMFEAEGREQEMVRRENPFALFLRTFLPWNNTRDMALREALRSANIPDPVAERNRLERRQEEEEYEEEQREEDDAEWETEDSWEVGDFSLDSDPDL